MFGVEGKERRWEGWLEYILESPPKKKSKDHGPSMKKYSTHKYSQKWHTDYCGNQTGYKSQETNLEIKINAKITWAGIVKLRLKACKHVIEGLQFGLILICWRISRMNTYMHISYAETCSPEACKLLPIQKQHSLLAKAQYQGTQCFWLQASLKRLISDTSNND